MAISSRLDPRTPVIVGAGQVTRRTDEGEGRDPISLAVEALRRAGADSGTDDALLRRAESVRHVATIGWQYRDEAALVADAVGASPRESVRTAALGGDAPQRLVGDTARAIADGEVDVALVAGAEALATASSLQRSGGRPSWPVQDSGEPTRVVGFDRHPITDAEFAVGLVAPVNVYALLETAVRARGGTDRDEHLQRIAALWSGFSRVAAGNPHAWLPRERTAQEIATATADNRRVSEPYTKLLTANIQVDQAAALILCSAEAAAGAGVPKDRWVFPVASAFARDEWFVSERFDLTRSPAISAACTAVLQHAGVSIDEVAYLDLYSCFPSAVQIAATELGVALDDPDRPLTVTGGLTFAGGPGNNYSTHAVATLVARLREDPSAVGVASALGWYVSKHAYGLYSATAPGRPFREIDAGDRVRPTASRRACSDHTGPATVEAYTVPYSRDGLPEAVILSALAPDGTRALARSAEPEVLDVILGGDPCGRRVVLAGAGRVQLGDAVRPAG
jgi:acetyl-CoA C-acetyltransferase